MPIRSATGYPCSWSSRLGAWGRGSGERHQSGPEAANRPSPRGRFESCQKTANATMIQKAADEMPQIK